MAGKLNFIAFLRKFKIIGIFEFVYVFRSNCKCFLEHPAWFYVSTSVNIVNFFVLLSRRILQLQNIIMDLQSKLNHEAKEREVDQSAILTRYGVKDSFYVSSTFMFALVRAPLWGKSVLDFSGNKIFQNFDHSGQVFAKIAKKSKIK